MIRECPKFMFLITMMISITIIGISNWISYKQGCEKGFVIGFSIGWKKEIEQDRKYTKEKGSSMFWQIQAGKMNEGRKGECYERY